MATNLISLRGEFLLKAIDLEYQLDNVLRQIFNPSNNVPFQELILPALNFEKKINIIFKMVKNDRLAEIISLDMDIRNDIKKLMNDIVDIKEIRNCFAHNHFEHPDIIDEEVENEQTISVKFSKKEDEIEVFYTDGGSKIFKMEDIKNKIKLTRTIILGLETIATLIYSRQINKLDSGRKPFS